LFDAENSLKVASWEIGKIDDIKTVLKSIDYEDWRVDGTDRIISNSGLWYSLCSAWRLCYQTFG
jgi:hypothetical protein